MNEKWFLLSISQIEKKLKTNAALGLSRKAARSAWRFFSPKAGSLFIRKNKSVGKMLTEILADFALILLLILSTLAVMFEEQSIGITVFGIVFINIFISLVFYYRAQRSLDQINEYFLPVAKVISECGIDVKKRKRRMDDGRKTSHYVLHANRQTAAACD